MSFNNLLLAVALTVLWPLVLMGVLAAAEWLERRTLTAREVGPRGLRPAASAPPEPVPAAMAGAAGTDAGMASASGAAGRGSPAGSPGGAPGEAAAGAPGEVRDPLGPGGVAEPADGDRVAARRPFGGGGRHLRRAGGGRHERRG